MNIIVVFLQLKCSDFGGSLGIYVNEVQVLKNIFILFFFISIS